MSDIAYQNAIAARDAAIEEIAQIEQRLVDLRAQIVRIENFLGEWSEFAKWQIPNDHSSVENHGDSPQERVKNPRKEDVAAMARQIIAVAGRPVSRGELFPRLRELGINIDGKHPQMVLSTMLWRMRDQVVRLAEGYWLAEEPYPPLAYDPANKSVITEALQKAEYELELADQNSEQGRDEYSQFDGPTTQG